MITIGIGSDISGSGGADARALLARIASSAGDFYMPWEVGDLTSIYKAIVANSACRDGTNHPPTLNSITTLPGGLINTPFTIAYQTLKDASDAADADGNTISFQIESVASGTTLTKNGTSVVASPTLLGSGESLVWQPPTDQTGTGLSAFAVRAFDGTLTSSVDVPVKVAVSLPNNPPVVYAGPDLKVLVGQDANLTGVVTDDGQRLSSPQITWSMVSGPGTVQFGNINLAATTANCDTPGLYVLRLTADDGQFTVHNDVQVTAVAANQPPTVKAGNYASVFKPSGSSAEYQLQGYVADDGLPYNYLASAWSVASAPTGATVTFADATSPATTVSFSAVGTYVLTLSAYEVPGNTTVAASDTITIDVYDGEFQTYDIMLVTEWGNEINGAIGTYLRTRQAIDHLSLERNRVGLIGHTRAVYADNLSGYWSIWSPTPAAFVQNTLTHDANMLKNATPWGNYYDSYDPYPTMEYSWGVEIAGDFVGDDYLVDGIKLAIEELHSSRANPDAQPVMVLFAHLPGPGWLPPDGYYESIIAMANEAKARGVRIIVQEGTIGSSINTDFKATMQAVASSSSDYFDTPNESSSDDTLNAYLETLPFNVAKRVKVDAGVDQTVTAIDGGSGTYSSATSPPGQISLSGSATSAYGSIASYHWDLETDLASGTTVSIASPNSASTTVQVSGQNGPNGVYVFKLTATDSAGVTGSSFVSVRVTAVPVDDFFVVKAGSSDNVIDVFANDPGHGSPDWGYTLNLISPNPRFGGKIAVSSASTGELTYTPAANFSGGVETFSYSLKSGGADVQVPYSSPAVAEQATIRIFVESINGPPIATNFSVTVAQNSQLEVDYTGQWHDANLQEDRHGFYPARIISLGSSENGLVTASIGNGGPAMLINAGSTLGMDTFSYTVADTYGVTSTGHVTVNVTDDLTQFGYQANDDYVNVPYGASQVTINVLQNDSYTLAAPTAIYSFTTPSGDTVARDGSTPPNLVYTPSGTHSTPVEFSYKLYNSTDPKATANVHVGFLDNVSTSLTGGITSLEPDSGSTYKRITNPVFDVLGTAYDANNQRSLISYSLVLYSGSTEIKRWSFVGSVGTAAGNLGQVDLTDQPNGFYLMNVEVQTLDGSVHGAFLSDYKLIYLGSEAKPGHFTMSVTDLTVPIDGVPLTISRNYDSWDKTLGSFGKAWQMNVGAGTLVKSGPLGAGWIGTEETGALGLDNHCIRNNGQMITINLGSGREFQFLAQANLTAGTGGSGPSPCDSTGIPTSLYSFTFVNMPGTMGTLQIASPPSSWDLDCPDWGVADQEPLNIKVDGAIYDTDDFIYTDISGKQYFFSSGQVTKISYQGKSIEFDFSGTGSEHGVYLRPTPTTSDSSRIQLAKVVMQNGVVSSIYSPNELTDSSQPATLLYEYATDNYNELYFSETIPPYLIRVKRLVDKSDLANPVYQTLSYEYGYTSDPWNFSQWQYITSIKGPSGGVRNEYDDSGKLIATTDPIGARTTFAYSTGGSYHSGDAVGSQTTTDALGHTTVQEYDGQGNVVGSVDAAGKLTLRTFDTKNNKTSETDPLDRVTSFGNSYFSGSDQISQIATTPPHTLVSGDSTRDEDSDFASTTVLNTSGQVTSVTDANGHGVTTTYVTANNAAFGKVASVTDANGKVTGYAYSFDSGGALNKIDETDPLGNKTTTTLDVYGNALSVSVFKNIGSISSPSYNSTPDTETDCTYTPNGDMATEITTRTLPGTTTHTETIRRTSNLDATGKLLSTLVEHKVDSGAYSTVSDGSPVRVYDDTGRLQSETRTRTLPDTTMETQVTSYEYNARGDLISATYPDGKFTESTYDLAGRLVASTDRSGLVTQHVYDPVGREIQTLLTDGTTTSTVYDDAGQVTSSTDRRGGSMAYTYYIDRRRQTVTAHDPITGDHTTTYTYDKVGNMLTAKDPANNTTSYEYDASNRRTKVTYPDNTYAVTVYNDGGQRVEEINQDGVSTGFEYDALGRLVAVTNAFKLYTMSSGGPPSMTDDNPADKTITTYVYDEAGNLMQQTDAEGRVTKFEYDAVGRRTKRTLPNGQVETFVYDDLGQMTSHLDFNAKTTTFAYDSLGRLTTKTPDSSFNMDPVIFTYLDDGQRSSMTYPLGPGNGSETVTYEYQAGRLWKKITPVGTITYSYDTGGNLATIKVPHSSGSTFDYSVAYNWDALNRLDQVDDANDTVIPTRCTYDAAGNLGTVAYPNGVVTTYNYNSLNRLTDMSAGSTAGTLATFNYNPSETGRTLGASGNAAPRVKPSSCLMAALLLATSITITTRCIV